MKNLGLLLVCSLPVIWGFDFSFKLKNKIVVFEDFLKSVRFIKDEIRFSSREINEIFMLMKSKNILKNNIFYDILNGKLKNNLNFVADSFQKNGLKRQETEFVVNFFNGLGSNDTGGQLNHCDYYISKTEEKIKVLNNDFRLKNRLYLSLSFAASATLFILTV